MSTQVNISDVVAAKLGQIVNLKSERRETPPLEFERAVARICGEQALRQEINYVGAWPAHALMIHQALASPPEVPEERGTFWRYLTQDWLPAVNGGLDAPLRPDRQGHAYILPQALLYMSTRESGADRMVELLDRHVTGWRDALAARWLDVEAGAEGLRDTFALSPREEINFLAAELAQVNFISKRNALDVLMVSIRAGALMTSTPKDLYVKVLTSGLRLDDSLQAIHASHGGGLPSGRTVGHLLDDLRRQNTGNPVFTTWETLFMRARLSPSGEKVESSHMMPSL